MSETAPPKLDACRACGHLNERPYIFCDACGVSRIRLGHWRVTINLSLALSAFLGAYSFSGALAWNWPLYLLFAIFFTEFSMALVAGYARLMLRFLLWFASTFALFGTLFTLAHRDETGLVILTLAGGPDAAATYPWIFWPTLAAILVAIFLPCYFRWSRKYGWVNAYRTVLLALLLAALALYAALQLLAAAHARALYPSLQDFLAELMEDKPHYDQAFLFFSLTAFRVFLFEIFIFAAVRGYATTVRAGGAPRPDLRRESAFTKSVIHLALILKTFGHILENMARYVVATLVELARDIARVVLAFLREILCPALAMVACGVLLYTLTRDIDAYIADNRLVLVLRICGAILGVLLADMAFMLCKTPFRPRRVLAFHAQLIGWLLPNLLVFFLLLSLSLYTSSLAVNRYQLLDHDLPFRIGILTKAVAVFLAVLVAFVFLRKRRLLMSGQPAGTEAPPGPPEAPREPRPLTEDDLEEPEEAAEEISEREGAAEEEATVQEAIRQRNVRGRLARGATEVGETIGEALQDLGGVLIKPFEWLLESETGKRARGAVKDTHARVQGRPRVTVELVRARNAVREKQAQISNLKASREAISERTYSSLLSRYEQELLDLRHTRDRLQEDLDLRYAEAMTDRRRQKKELDTLDRQQAELQRLVESGAMDREEHRRRAVNLRSARNRAAFRLRAAEQMIRFLESYASKKAARRAPAPDND